MDRTTYKPMKNDPKGAWRYANSGETGGAYAGCHKCGELMPLPIVLIRNQDGTVDFEHRNRCKCGEPMQSLKLEGWK